MNERRVCNGSCRAPIPPGSSIDRRDLVGLIGSAWTAVDSCNNYGGSAAYLICQRSMHASVWGLCQRCKPRFSNVLSRCGLRRKSPFRCNHEFIPHLLSFSVTYEVCDFAKATLHSDGALSVHATRDKEKQPYRFIASLDWYKSLPLQGIAHRVHINASWNTHQWMIGRGSESWWL